MLKHTQGNWPACQATGKTCVLPLNNTAIDADAKCEHGNLPAKMIDIQSLDTLYSDIEAAFSYTRSTKTPLVIKNTGHDWKGRSSGPGSLALWTHKLQHPTVPIKIDWSFTPAGCSDHPSEIVFHYGPGQQWGKAYEFADRNGLAIVGGTCGTVGIAGWLQGGGHSPLSPIYGMGVDNVRQLEIITPKGGKVIANECQNSDLFFAMKGGGGGTFGVITSITYKAIEKHELQVCSI
jgi:FAD binding domain-containing protein